VSAEHFDLRIHRWQPDERRGDYYTIVVRAGVSRTEHVVPPAGEEYAFDRQVWPHEVQVQVSPTGRSVQVFVDGEKVL